MNTHLTSAYKGDIVSRLRNWRRLHLAHSGILFEEAADEIERLRLTDAEREAVTAAIRWCEMDAAGDVVSRYCAARAATLRGLLSRMGDFPAPDNAAGRNNGTAASV